MHILVVILLGRSSGRKRERGKKRMFQDYYGADVFSSGEVSVPTNPFFVTITRKTRVNEMVSLEN